MLQQKCFIILVPYDRNEGSCDDADEERRVKTEKENVTERRVRDADATDDDGRRQNDAADHRRHRVDVNQEHETFVKSPRHLERKKRLHSMTYVANLITILRS